MNCTRPNAPDNGLLGEVTLNTAQFGCKEGYSPQETMTAVCVATDTWSPDPAQLECTAVIATTNDGDASGRCTMVSVLYKILLREVVFNSNMLL